MNLNELLIELLYTHDCVVIPGVGGFLLNYSAATIHPVQHFFQPPSRTIAFNSALNSNDGLLASAISSKLGISFSDSMEKVRSYALDINLKLQTAGSFQFELLGRLLSTPDGLVSFEPEKGLNLLADAYGLPSFSSPAINRGTYHPTQPSGRLNRKPKRNSAALPVFARWVLMILPIIAVGSWLYFNAGPSHIQPADKASFGFESLTQPVDSKPAPETISNQAETPNDVLPDVRPSKLKEEPVTEAEPVSPAPEGKGSEVFDCQEGRCYCIVVGCFANQSNVDNMLVRLEKLGIAGFADGLTASGLRRVCAGKYPNYQKAVADLELIRVQVANDAWLYKL